MFENAGAKLRSIIYGCVVVSMIAVIIVGLVIMFSGDYDGSFLIGSLVIVVGVFFVWFSNLFIMAFLEMIEDVHAIKLMMQNENAGSRLTASSPFETTPTAQIQTASGYSSLMSKLSGEDTSKIWYCRECGTKNKTSSRTCSGCGAEK